MAAYVPRVDGLLTDATVFGKCCHFVIPLNNTAPGANFTGSTSGTGTLTNGNSFTLASPTEIDAIGFLMSGRTNGTPDGFLNAYIVSGSTEQAGTRIQVAVHSLPLMSYGTAGYGWVVMKFTAPVTLAAGTYNVVFYTTAGSQVAYYMNNTITGNPPCHFVRTTEQTAPGGNDSIIVAGEYPQFDPTDLILQDSDDFSGSLTGWTAVGGGTQSQSISSGELNYVVTSGTTDPTKYIRTGGYSGADVMVKCKVKVNSFTANTSGRVGIVLRSTSSGQGGLSLLFRGDSTSTVIMLNEGVQFSSGFNFTWTTGVYYYMKLAVIGNRMFGKVWAASGSEPSHWMVSYLTNGSRTTGFAGLVGGSGVATNATFDEFEVYSIGGQTTFNTRQLTIDTIPASPITFQYMSVSRGGTAKFDLTKDTLLRFATNGSNSSGVLFPLTVHYGGRFEMGSTTANVPSSVTATLECVGGTSADIMTVWEGGTFLAHGADTRTRRTTLTANTAASGTTLTHGTVTGWTIGDVIGICGTSRNNFAGSGTNQNEQRTIATPGSTSTVVSSGFTYAHDGGVTPTGSGHTFGAMVVNLTRNVKIQGTSSTGTVGIFFGQGATLDIRYVQHRYWGSSSNPRRGYYINGNTVGTFLVKGCSFYDLKPSANSMCFYHLNGTGYVSILDNVALGHGGGDYFYYNEGIPSQNDAIITGNCCIGFSAASYQLNDANVICSDNWGGGCGPGLLMAGSKTPREANNNYFYNCNYAIYNNTPVGYYIDGWRAWRTREVAIWQDYVGFITTPNINSRYAVEISSFIAAGCGNVGATATCYLRRSGHMIIRDSKIYSDPSATVNYGWANGGEDVTGICEIFNTVIGTTGYTFVSAVAIRGQSAMWIHLDDCPLGLSSIPVANQTFQSYSSGAGVGFTNYNGTDGDNRTYKGQGTIQTDTAIYKTASPSIRLTPNSASYKLTSEGLISGFLVQCAAGSFKTINVYVRKSVVGDGTAYNGNQPRLMMRSNYAGGGVSTDQVLATAAGAAGSWELLSGVTPSALINTTFEFYIDCDGTTGWVNVDDITIT